MRNDSVSEYRLQAVRRALAARSPEQFPVALANTGLDEATLAACVAELAHRREVDFVAPRSGFAPGLRLTRRGRRRAGRPGWRESLGRSWRGVQPKVIDIAWKIAAAVAAASVIGALGLG